MQTTAWASEWSAVEQPAYRPSATRAKWAMWLIGITAAVLALGAITVLEGFSVLDGDGPSVTSWSANLDTIDDLYVVALLASAVAFFGWFTRVIDNVEALGGGRPGTSPRMAVVWWFIPIAFLIKPPMVVADVWRRMATTTAERGTVLIAAWWLLWVAGNFIGRSVEFVTVDTYDDFRGLLTIMSVGLVAHVVAGGLLVRIVWEIERRARIRAAAIKPTVTSDPAPAWAGPAAPASAPLVHALAAAPAPSAVADGSLPPESALAFCPECGTARLPGARFCGRCGTHLGASAGG